jgi:hypothetical protein
MRFLAANDSSSSSKLTVGSMYQYILCSYKDDLLHSSLSRETGDMYDRYDMICDSKMICSSL